MDPHSIDKLFIRNVPHILEIIFFSLDYKSFKACFDVCNAWNELLTSDYFQRKGKSVFDKEISEDETNLWRASRDGILKEVRRLLSNGLVDVNSIRTVGKPPLLGAAYGGHMEVIKFLLDKKAELEQLDDGGETALYMAACKGHVDVVKLLLNKGAKPNVVTKCRATPLYTAARNGHGCTVKVLVEGGANLD